MIENDKEKECKFDKCRFKQYTQIAKVKLIQNPSTALLYTIINLALCKFKVL